MTVVPTSSLDAVLAEFTPGRHFLLTAHIRPDGDAVGSLLALAELLDQLGCTAEVVLADPVPFTLRSLPGANRILPTPQTPDAPAIILECNSLTRTGLPALADRYTINIDHHASGDNFADRNWIDSTAPAVGCMIYDLVVAAGLPLTPGIATNLYTAILSDTLGFTTAGTSARTLRMVAHLADAGAEPGQIARDICLSNPECRMRLLGESLVHMQRRGPVAWSWATLADLDRLHASAEDCDGVVNHLLGIEGVEAAFFLRELPEHDVFRLSLRSKSPFDVSTVAESFGGGGHRASSACTLSGALDDVIVRVLDCISERGNPPLW